MVVPKLRLTPQICFPSVSEETPTSRFQVTGFLLRPLSIARAPRALGILANTEIKPFLPQTEKLILGKYLVPIPTHPFESLP